jgi:hypothetical protein
MIRLTLLGRPVPSFHDVGGGSASITAGAVIKAQGGNPDAGVIAVNGKVAGADTPLQPGDSVSQRPLMEHG